MRKLFQFKTWYTLEEAAARLSLTLSEPVLEGDIVQFAAEGHVKVCWFLKGDHFARKATVYCPYPKGESGYVLSEPDYDKNGESWGICLAGVLELPMDLCPSWGWWLLTFIGKGGESQDWCGPLVVDEDESIWELYESGNSDFHHFPKKEEIVIRAKDLEKFELQAKEDAEHPNVVVEIEKPVSSRERNNLLKIIGALCTAQGLDLSKPYKTAEIIKSQLELSGVSMSTETIASKLAEINKS